MRPGFTLFHKLPGNVQSIIWEEACYFPNVLQTEISFSFLGDPEYSRAPNPELLERAWLPGKIFYKVPAVLHTCFESRRVALRIYDQVGNPFRGKKVYMNREVDIMFFDAFFSLGDAYLIKWRPGDEHAWQYTFSKHDYFPQHILVDERWDKHESSSTSVLKTVPGLKTIMSRSGGASDVVEICETEDFKHKLVVGENDKMPTLHFLTAEQIASMRPKGPAPPLLLHPHIPAEYASTRPHSLVWSRLRILPSWVEPHSKLFKQQLQELSNYSRNLRSQRMYIPPFDHAIWLSLERIRRYKLEYYRLQTLFDNSMDKLIYEDISVAFQSGNSMPSMGKSYSWDKWAEGTVDGGAFPYKHPYWQDDLRNNKWGVEAHLLRSRVVLHKHTLWENYLMQQFRNLPNREKARLYTLALGSALEWIVHVGGRTVGRY